MKKSLLAGLTAMLCGTTIASAAPIQLSFTASDFFTDPTLPPISGSIFYESASTTAVIDSLTAIDLTIDGYTYTLGEIAFSNGVDGIISVGGILSGVTGLGSGPDDFLLRWEPGVPTSDFFAYSDGASFFATRTVAMTFTDLSNVNRVPEPGTAALALAVLLAGAGAAVRRRR
ncbi:MAG: PEP-CTERM sorting domain-containing protein [Burkholderiales bacterium]|nr:PEP-CTERM sorting domain-containing protein [Burkholderiales bacterium]